MVLEHIRLTKFFKIINGLGPYRPIWATTVYVHSDLPWQKRVTNILIILSQWKPCIVIGIYLEIICQLICFVMVGQNGHGSGSKGTIRSWTSRGQNLKKARRSFTQNQKVNRYIAKISDMLYSKLWKVSTASCIPTWLDRCFVTSYEDKHRKCGGLCHTG